MDLPIVQCMNHARQAKQYKMNIHFAILTSELIMLPHALICAKKNGLVQNPTHYLLGHRLLLQWAHYQCYPAYYPRYYLAFLKSILSQVKWQFSAVLLDR